MTEIIPAVLPETYADIAERAAQVRGIVSRIQIDITDGTYAPSVTWPFQNDAGEFARLVSGAEDLPYRKELSYELDMMVECPEHFLSDWISAGVSAVIVHVNSTQNIAEIIAAAHERGVSVGLALAPSVPNDALVPYMGAVDFVQFMGSDTIGFHGEALMPCVYEKIRTLRDAHPDIPIAVDIGVNQDTAPKLVAAGATKLVSGSAIWQSGDVARAIKTLGAF